MRILDIGATFGLSAYRVFNKWKPSVEIPKLLKDVDEVLPTCDFVIFGGGGDIHPSLYGQAIYGAATGRIPSYRDNFEVYTFKRCREANIPILGICRGAQMMCALAGGQLFQHVSGHGKDHTIITADGESYVTTSVHHQMMCPQKIKHELIAWANGIARDVKFDTAAKIQYSPQEPEIVYFPETRALGIQGHPEFVADLEHPFVKYCRNLTATKLLGRPDLVEKI